MNVGFEENVKYHFALKRGVIMYRVFAWIREAERYRQRHGSAGLDTEHVAHLKLLSSRLKTALAALDLPPETAAQDHQDVANYDGLADSDDTAAAAAACARSSSGSREEREERGEGRERDATSHAVVGQTGAAAAGAHCSSSPAVGGGASSPCSPSAVGGVDGRCRRGLSSSSSAMSVLSSGLSRARRHIRKTRAHGEEAGKGLLAAQGPPRGTRGDCEEVSGGEDEEDDEASDDVERDDVSLLTR